MKFLIVLCLGVLAVQAQNPIDDIVRDLEDLNREATEEQTKAIDQLGGELRSVDELGQELLRDLGQHLNDAVGGLEQQIRDLEDEARRLRVDISECVGGSEDEIAALPLRVLGEAGECINLGHAQAEQAVNNGVRQVNEAVGPIDIYWREVERCREAGRQEQDICVAQLETEIRNDQVQIPARIHLAVGEVIGHLEAEKTALLLCPSGKVERLNEEGGHVVRRVTDCAERLFPPGPNPKGKLI